MLDVVCHGTIVIFDRVREILSRLRGTGLAGILNASINETLPRTLLTGGTTLATALLLAFFAGEVIRPFALVMSFGIVVGTFSSIFVAAPLLLWIDSRRSTASGTDPAAPEQPWSSSLASPSGGSRSSSWSPRS